MRWYGMIDGGYMGMTQSEVVRYDGWWLYEDDPK